MLLPQWISKPCDFVHIWNWITSAASKLTSLWKLFTSVLSVNSLDALVAENMLFAEAGSSSCDLKGFVGICDKQYSDFLFDCIFYMASAKEECDLASHVKSLPCSGNIASVNQFLQ